MKQRNLTIMVELILYFFENRRRKKKTKRERHTWRILRKLCWSKMSSKNRGKSASSISKRLLKLQLMTLEI